MTKCNSAKFCLRNVVDVWAQLDNGFRTRRNSSLSLTCALDELGSQTWCIQNKMCCLSSVNSSFIHSANSVLHEPVAPAPCQSHVSCAVKCLAYLAFKIFV